MDLIGTIEDDKELSVVESDDSEQVSHVCIPETVYIGTVGAHVIKNK